MKKENDNGDRLIRFMSGYIPTHPAYLSIKLQTIVGKLID